MSGAPDNHFKIKLGRIVSHSGSKQVVRLTARLGRASKSYRRRPPRSFFRSSQKRVDFFSRRVIVKVGIVNMNRTSAANQAAHIDYINRESAAKDHERQHESDKTNALTAEQGRDDDRGNLYNDKERGVSGEDFIKRTADDPRQFRIIVSPEDSRKMTDLTSFTRELMGEMEATLGTKLDWIAADHYDKATPHIHIVISGRDTMGRQVILPRDYIRQGMRMQAQQLVSIELGPVLQPEAGLKLARQVTQERFTGLDRALIKMSRGGIVDLSRPPEIGEDWSRRFDKARLQTLGKLGLAHRQGRHHWKLSKDLEATLREFGERGDIIRTLQKSLTKRGMNAVNIPVKIYDPSMGDMTGRILDLGVRDDVNDKSFMVVDSLDHGPLHVEMGRSENIEALRTGDVLSLNARVVSPKPSDHTIVKVASLNGGTYGYNEHKALDKSVRIKYVEAHIRRLEAMRRLGLVTRRKDGLWEIPSDYLERAQSVEAKKAKGNPILIKWRNRTPMNKLSSTIGKTWLDRRMMERTEVGSAASVFASELKEAQKLRRKYLVQKGILESQSAPLQQKHLDQLEVKDLENAGEKIGGQIGKSYAASPKRGTVDGILIDKIERPSGDYAIIERARDFTLVPWKQELEKRRGLQISGSVSSIGISWRFGRKRGLDIS